MILPNIKVNTEPDDGEMDVNQFEMEIVNEDRVEEYKYEYDTTREGALQILYNEYVERI